MNYSIIYYVNYLLSSITSQHTDAHPCARPLRGDLPLAKRAAHTDAQTQRRTDTRTRTLTLTACSQIVLAGASCEVRGRPGGRRPGRRHSAKPRPGCPAYTPRPKWRKSIRYTELNFDVHCISSSRFVLVAFAHAVAFKFVARAACVPKFRARVSLSMKVLSAFVPNPCFL